MDVRRATLWLALGAALGVGVSAGGSESPAGRVGHVVAAGQAGGGRGAAGRGATAAASGTGVILGTVVDGLSGKPIAEAVVTLGAPSVSQPPVIVDRNGRFAFTGLPAASFPLVATRAGYFGGGAGQRTPTGPRRPIELGAGDRVTDVILRLWPYAIVAGSVRDSEGEPVAGLTVELLERALANGEWRLERRASTHTDDRGAYRFSKAMPGRYLVGAREEPDGFLMAIFPVLAADLTTLMGFMSGAMVGGGVPELDFHARVIPMTFAPSAMASADAAAVVVRSGEDRTNVDIRVARMPAYRVTGDVTGVERLPPNLRIQLISPALFDQPAGINLTNGQRGGGAGRFDFGGVPPGDYVLRASAVPQPTGRGRGTPPGAPVPEPPSDPTWWAEAPVVVVDRDLTGLTLPLGVGPRLSGRVVFEGSADPSFGRVGIAPQALDRPGAAGFTPPGGVATDGRFRTGGLVPGRYLLTVPLVPPGWRVRSIRAGGRDVTDLPIEIGAEDLAEIVVTLTDELLGSLGGVVRNARGAIDPDAVVLLFPVDRRFWANLTPGARRLKSARVSSAGAYAIPGLPEGEYFVVATDEEVLADWQQVAVLESLTGTATRVVIAGVGRVTQDLVRSNR